MTSEHKKPWHTPDFELKFRQAMGRDMTPQEREFFGLDNRDSTGEPKPDGHSSGNTSKYAWQALRRISSLIG